MSTFQQANAVYESGDFATARRMFSALADDGDLNALQMLGWMHSHGEGGRQNLEEAVRIYRRGALAGHAVAQHSLASLYAQGRGVPLDFGEALRWYKAAAAQGMADALFKVGVMYMNGEGTAPNASEAEKWWRQAAAQKYGPAMLFLGHLYSSYDFNSQGSKDVVQAVEWYLQAWQAGLVEGPKCALDHMAELIQTADTAPPDGSATRGTERQTEAQHQLGVINKYFLKNDQEAIRRLMQAGRQNHPAALRLLGYICHNGEGMPADKAKAARIFLQSARLGDKYGQLNVAKFYHRGDVFERDLDRAIHWYRMAVSQDVFDALEPLAHALAARNRDRADVNEAVQRLMQVALAGPRDASYQLQSGNGDWSIHLTDGGTNTVMHGISLDELVGLPANDFPDGA